MVAILLGVMIALYSGWVIYRKMKDAKAGKFCSCDDCGDCSASCNKKM